MLCACHFICIICISTQQMQTKILEWHQNEINDFFVCLKWINIHVVQIYILLVNYWCVSWSFEFVVILDLLQGSASFSIFLWRYRLLCVRKSIEDPGLGAGFLEKRCIGHKFLKCVLRLSDFATSNDKFARVIKFASKRIHGEITRLSHVKFWFITLEFHTLLWLRSERRRKRASDVTRKKFIQNKVSFYLSRPVFTSHLRRLESKHWLNKSASRWQFRRAKTLFQRTPREQFARS